MKKLEVFAGFALFGLVSFNLLAYSKSGIEDWCPRGKKVNGTIEIEGIVDYEDINWCKVVINLPSSKLELYYTADGKLVRVIEYKRNKKRAELDFKEKNIDLRIFDREGNLFEEFKSRETF